jgi:hypothetical protein
MSPNWVRREGQGALGETLGVPWEREKPTSGRRDNQELVFGGCQAQGKQLTLARNTKATISALLVGHDA